jgi:hypothetical protein
VDVSKLEIMDYILEKDISENITVYFKGKDRTGHTNTDSKKEAVVFGSKDAAIDYNYKWLYGDYIAVIKNDK